MSRTSAAPAGDSSSLSAIARALDLMTEGDFAEMAKQVWLMEQAAKSGDLEKAVEADLRFHDIVISTSGQTHTLQIWRSIWPRIRAYFYRYGRGRSLEVMADEHRELLEAMQAPEVAERVLGR